MPRPTARTARAFAVTFAICLFAAGAILRIAVLRVAVPEVDDSWRAWSYHAATEGPSHMYGPKGHVVSFGRIDAPVVYPPLALDELAIVGRVHLALNHGRFPDGPGLTMAIKGALALLDAAMALLIFVVVRRLAGSPAAWWGAAVYWLNPAVLMITTLGYFDAFLALPAVAALVAASLGRPWLAGACLTAAVLTKPQGVLIAPAVALALWNAGSHARERLAAAAAAAGLTTAILVAPMVVAGTTWYMVRSVAVLAGHDMLSALAFNLWWVVSYLFEAAAVRGDGWRAALFAHPGVMTHADAIARGFFPHPRIVGTLLLGAAVGWALTTAFRARDLAVHAALAAFIVDAYFTLSVQVHENHFFLVLPLLVLAAALRRAFAPVLAALSVSFALNLYLMMGWHGEGPIEPAIAATGVDATVLLALANCALCGWLGVMLWRACRDAPLTATA